MLDAQIERIVTKHINQHGLPPAFVATAHRHFAPLAAHVAQWHTQKSSTLYLGINGAQDSGKSTLAHLLVDLLQQIHKKVLFGCLLVY